MSIRPDETEIVGSWALVNGKVIEDENCLRLRKLAAEELTALATSNSGWEKLFRDPKDGRLWEWTHPKSEMHGGGPPSLRVISAEAARRKYGA